LLLFNLNVLVLVFDYIALVPGTIIDTCP